MTVRAWVDMTISLINDGGMIPVVKNFSTFSPIITTSVTPGWPGYGGNGSSFVFPFGTNASVVWITNSVYNYGNATYPNPSLIVTALNSQNFLDKGILPLPHFGLLSTNRLQVVMLDWNQHY
ncbi:MAG: hypothetical protein WDM76_19210 [Limisphaerales bacterium]